VPVDITDTITSSDLIRSGTASGSYESSFDPYDLSSDDDEYQTPNNVAETTCGRFNRPARLFPTSRLYFNLAPAETKNWGEINPNLYDYHSDQMEISSTFWIPDITDWWHQ
jgi:hypothetical protein